MPIHNLRRCSKISNNYDIDMGCSLKGSTALAKKEWYGLHTCIRYDFYQLFQIWGSVCGGNGVSMKPYAHPEPDKALKHLIYVSHGHGIPFERFYSQSIAARFGHLHQSGFQPILTNLGKCL
jgi:hypothetical protein